MNLAGVLKPFHIASTERIARNSELCEKRTRIKEHAVSSLYANPRQILTCSSILTNVPADRTPIGGYLSKVFSSVVT
jgi:hypothetical protein